jgi:RNA polymerase sigma-70 factor (ECF subfamily)
VSSDDVLVARFEADRRHLQAVAYRLVGSLHDAEDAVQQAWLKASQADLREVQNLSGWLTTVTARECLDLLRARRRRGEVTLPEGAGEDRWAGTGGHATAYGGVDRRTGEDEALLADSVGVALLVVLERLSPLQRVAFVLHDLFSIPFEEVGRVLGRSPVAAKKLASRARERVRGDAGRRVDAGHYPLVEAFLAASRGGDLAGLLELLAPGVVRRADAVLLPAGGATEVHGAARVAEESKAFTARARAGAVAWVDGAPGIVVAPKGRLMAVLRIGVADGRIQLIDIVGAKDRLDRVVIEVPGR